MVGAILRSFTPVMYVCGLLLIFGWLAEWKLPRPGRTGFLWWAQGISSMVMLLIALYLGQALMPRLVALQSQAVVTGVKEATWPSPQVKAEFDAAHKGYSGMTKIVVFLGLGALLALSLRTTATIPAQKEIDVN
jgi:hypothetical protein